MLRLESCSSFLCIIISFIHLCHDKNFNTTLKMDHEFKSELIKLIRGHELIWNPESPDHNNKKSLAESWGKITVTLGRDDVREVRRTWKTLRTQFFYEAKKAETNWKFFKELKFIEKTAKRPVVKRPVVKKPINKKPSGKQEEKTDILNDPAYGDLDNIKSPDFDVNWLQALFSNDIVSDSRTSISPSSQLVKSSEESISADHNFPREFVRQSTDNGRIVSILLFVLSLVQEIKLAKCIASLEGKILDVISKQPTIAPTRTGISSSSLLRDTYIEKYLLTQVFSNRSPDNDVFIDLFVCSLVSHLLQAKYPAALKYEIWKTISQHRQEEQKEEEEEEDDETEENHLFPSTELEADKTSIYVPK